MRLREFDEKERLLKANEKLEHYKTAAGADATAADASGNFARGHKRFKGINAATKKQFDNDAKLSQLKEFAEQGVAEGEKHGLYYNVNKRKAAGTSRPANSPKAPTAQAWKDAAKTAKNESVAENQLDELSKDTLQNYVRAQPARIKGPAGLATTNNKKAARIVDRDIPRALDKYKDPEYGHQQRRLPEDSLAAMRRLAGVTTPAAAPNGPRQYRHMPTAVQPR